MMYFKRLPLLVVLALLLAVLPPTPSNAAGPSTTVGAEEGLGYAIPGSFLSPESAQGVDQDGRLLAFYVSNGNEELPMMLQVIDVEKQEVIFQQRAQAGINCWAVAFSEVERRVYFASTGGHLYSWRPGDTEITSHGKPARSGEGI